jgi:low affinity Fe/Cu permease
MKKSMFILFDRFSKIITRFTGSPIAFISAFLIIIMWAVLGPIFNFSDTWQLVINTGTTIITFLMVFVIQQSQNKDTTAIQLKLNELLASTRNASNRLVNLEDLTDDEIQQIKKFYVELSKLALEDSELYTTHSLDEAKEIHQHKQKYKKQRE